MKPFGSCCHLNETLASSKQEEQGVWVLIPAAGVGSRMNSAIPKQYLKIDGKTVLEHTVSRFDSLPHLAGILIVVSEADPYWESLESYFLELGNLKEFLFSLPSVEMSGLKLF